MYKGSFLSLAVDASHASVNKFSVSTVFAEIQNELNRSDFESTIKNVVS